MISESVLPVTTLFGYLWELYIKHIGDWTFRHVTAAFMWVCDSSGTCAACCMSCHAVEKAVGTL
jgi:hypothetical protein